VAATGTVTEAHDYNTCGNLLQSTGQPANSSLPDRRKVVTSHASCVRL